MKPRPLLFDAAFATKMLVVLRAAGAQELVPAIELAIKEHTSKMDGKQKAWAYSGGKARRPKGYRKESKTADDRHYRLKLCERCKKSLGTGDLKICVPCRHALWEETRQ